MVDQRQNILIAGAGISGPAVALLLSRAGHKCTIVERAPSFRFAGQQIDVDGNGLKVAQYMGIEDAIRACTVRDDGIKFIDTNNHDKILAEFAVGTTVGPGEWVREIEILRSDLARVLYDHTKDQVDYKFGDHIVDLQQDDSCVKVKFSQSSEEQKFDLVIAADGLRSKTRDLAFKPDNTDIVSLNMYVTFFDIPWQEVDGQWTKTLNDTEGRSIALRPRKEHGRTGAYLSQITNDCGRIATMPKDEQIQELLRRFDGVGWETPRILKDMQGNEGDNFYMQEIAQTKSTALANGRVALLGDAGYAPSPVTGQGTTLSFTGAYILAGCIATYPGPEGLAQYEKIVRPFVDKSQKLPPGLPWIIHPQTKRGLSIRDGVLRLAGFVANSRLADIIKKVGGPLSGMMSKNMELPDYPALQPQGR